MKEEIERAKYGGKKYVISNGFNSSSRAQSSRELDSRFVDEPFSSISLLKSTQPANLTHDTRIDTPKQNFINPNNLSKNLENKEFFNIISVGRFSKEKRHKILIKAISKSKYASRIKLHLHGSGPLESSLKTMCERNLQNKADFGFLDNNILLEKLGKMQLYVHPAEVESEAISCLEAVACGVTPLIANSKVSATRQFALDNRSLFKVNDVQDLADKIDFWIENPTLLEQMRPLYAKSATKYDLQKSIDSILQVYDEAISDFKQNPQLFTTPAS
ncbi:glycosyltransferase [Helicobacter saguini]|uniref:Glycosyltransferase n=2 Tax=Helicobacter saguini TaxID=1548018 RepID=A0A347W7F3_9HELI|nr:glycosyltransferase [Helicobacter saguini]MWV68060.1 glycosyltransferase [Helicobacter saguini]MWV70477.1 glycosyltransferase [Helicobacter saguini]MWV72378.1 glycosyltransferase [Helicobacter saguini]TLD92355.1 glycosyltransferase [Helicobacter saguini]